jgi:hypothetical protein
VTAGEIFANALTNGLAGSGLACGDDVFAERATSMSAISRVSSVGLLIPK